MPLVQNLAAIIQKEAGTTVHVWAGGPINAGRGRKRRNSAQNIGQSIWPGGNLQRAGTGRIFADEFVQCS